MTFPTIKKSLDLTSKLSDPSHTKGRSLRVGFYGGEPLLNIDAITRTVKYLNEKSERIGFNVQYLLTTNATLLHRHIDFLANNNFQLTISLDGSRSDNSYRLYPNGKSSYADIRRNIGLLRKKYPDYFNSNVSINTVLHDRNSIETATNHIQKEFGKITSISEISNIGVKKEREEEFSN